MILRTARTVATSCAKIGVADLDLDRLESALDRPEEVGLVA